MTLLRIIEQVIRLLALGLLDLRRAGIRRLLLAVLLVEAAALWVCAHPTSGLWAAWMVPLLRNVFGDYYLHYPQSFIGLPSTGTAARAILEVFGGPFVAAWCGLAVLRLADSHRPRETHLAAASRAAYVPVLSLTLLSAAVWIVVYALPQAWLLPRLTLGYRMHLLFSLGGSALPVLLLSPLFFALPHLLREKRGLATAVRSSFRLFRGDPGPPLLLNLLPWTLAVPFVLLLQRSAYLAGRLRPEIVLATMILAAAVSLAAEFIVIDASIRLYLRRGRSPS